MSNGRKPVPDRILVFMDEGDCYIKAAAVAAQQEEKPCE